ncbi:T9SS type A sorting domain-containing protein [Bacteroidales bacterium OttesenSCG-928-I21]|nr:T9SS type A sorting domain-containing protein [Bacteroidales bacterium OttesenSCG-928-I21]
MKKILLLANGILFLFTVNAQISLTKEANMPRVGDTFTYHTFSSISLNSGSAGANQTWDLSHLGEGNKASKQYTSLSESLYPGKYPKADLVERTEQSGATAEVYYSTASGLDIVGIYSAGFTECTFSDGQNLISFPLSYNSVISETFAGQVENSMVGQTFARSGDIKITADGYGTLKLPYGTVENVLRVKTTSSYIDKYMGQTFISYRDTSYYWYNAETRNFIANYSVGYYSYSVLGDDFYQQYSSTSMYLSKDNLSSGVTDNTISRSISVYPNPANTNDVVYVDLAENDEVAGWSLFNSMGQKIQENISCQGEKIKININNYPTGIYYIKISGKNWETTKKLMVK